MADCPISSLRLQEAGALAAVGCADGATTLLRLCDGLVDAQPAEKQTLAAVRSLSCTNVNASIVGRCQSGTYVSCGSSGCCGMQTWLPYRRLGSPVLSTLPGVVSKSVRLVHVQPFTGLIML